MPWTIDKSGNRTYKLSLFAKEELPTWGEMYEVWKSKEFFYDPENDDHQVPDIYWKVPRKKYLIAIMYNQLNKMIFEDKFDYTSLFKELQYRGEDCKITDMRFVYSSPPVEGAPVDELEKWASTFFCGTSCQPPIINIPMPTGEVNPFITNNYTRTDINELDYIEIIPVIIFDTDSYKNIMAIITPEFVFADYYTYATVLRMFMDPYVEYFKDPVGWKIIESKHVSVIGSGITDHCR